MDLGTQFFKTDIIGSSESYQCNNKNFSPWRNDLKLIRCPNENQPDKCFQLRGDEDENQWSIEEFSDKDSQSTSPRRNET